MAIRFPLTKQADTQQARIDALLPVAEKLIDKHGIGQFKLENLVEPSGLSRRTIYGIFESKDTIVAMIAIRMLKKHLVIQNKAANLEGCIRKHFFAIHIGHLILAVTYPDRYRCIYVCDIPLHKEKLSTTLVAEYSNTLDQIIAGYAKTIEAAIKIGEFVLPQHFTSTGFARFLWDNHYGTMLMAISSNNNFVHYIEHHNKYQNMIFDAMGWKPDSKMINFPELTKQVISECFAKDYSSAKTINPNFNLF